MAALRGGCLCGSVRFEVTREFESVSYCHCASCKKLSGGGGTVNGRVSSEAIRVLAGAALLHSFQPAEGSAKTFCSECGSNLFGGGWPSSPRASVRLTALDAAPRLPAASHIFVRSVAPWETLPDDGLERFEARATPAPGESARSGSQ